MKWEARIVTKGAVDADGNMEYQFVAVGDGADLSPVMSAKGDPSEIQQAVRDKVLKFANSYDTASQLPGEGETLLVVPDAA